jgi:hypothetical protein
MNSAHQEKHFRARPGYTLRRHVGSDRQREVCAPRALLTDSWPYVVSSLGSFARDPITPPGGTLGAVSPLLLSSRHGLRTCGDAG